MKKAVIVLLVVAIICVAAVGAVLFHAWKAANTPISSSDIEALDSSKQRKGALYAPAEAEHIADIENTTYRYVDNELDVFAADGVTENEIADLAEANQGRIVGYIRSIDYYVLRFDNAMTLEELYALAQTLIDSGKITCAEANFCASALELSEADPLFQESWGSWDGSYPNNWGQVMVDLPEAWTHDDAIQDSIKLGIIDSFLDFDHPDLQIPYRNATWTDSDHLDESGRDALRRCESITNAHGTLVAGIIGAQKNEIGIRGVVGNSEILARSGFYFDEQENVCKEDLLIYALEDLITSGCKVINMSLGFAPAREEDGSYRNPTSDSDADQAYRAQLQAEANRMAEVIRRLHDYPFLIVNTAGNESINADYCGFGLTNCADSMVRDRLIIVGSIDPEGNISEFSNYGENVDIVAPGKNIFSTGFEIKKTNAAGNIISKYEYTGEPEHTRYMKMSGTSMAAPFVTGVAALVWQHCPSLEPEDVKQIVMDTASRNHAITAPASDGNTYTYPVLNAKLAVDEAINRKKGGTLGTQAEELRILTTQNRLGNNPSNIIDGGFVAMQGDDVFYSHGGLYHMKSDGSNKRLLSDVNAFFLNVRGDWLYYCATTDEVTFSTEFDAVRCGIYRISIAEEGKGELIGEEIGSCLGMLVCGDWIYFSALNGRMSRMEDEEIEFEIIPERSLYRMKLDGSQKSEIVQDIGYGDFYIQSDTLYLTKAYPYVEADSGYCDYYAANLDGSNLRLLNYPAPAALGGTWDGYWGETFLADDDRFFLTDHSVLYAYDNTASNPEPQIQLKNFEHAVIQDGVLYYIHGGAYSDPYDPNGEYDDSMVDYGWIFRKNVNSEEPAMRLYSEPDPSFSMYINIQGDWLYFRKVDYTWDTNIHDGTCDLYRVRIDGSDVQNLTANAVVQGASVVAQDAPTDTEDASSAVLPRFFTNTDDVENIRDIPADASVLATKEADVIGDAAKDAIVVYGTKERSWYANVTLAAIDGSTGAIKATVLSDKHLYAAVAVLTAKIGGEKESLAITCFWHNIEGNSDCYVMDCETGEWRDLFAQHADGITVSGTNFLTGKASDYEVKETGFTCRINKYPEWFVETPFTSEYAFESKLPFYVVSFERHPYNASATSVYALAYLLDEGVYREGIICNIYSVTSEKELVLLKTVAEATEGLYDADFLYEKNNLPLSHLLPVETRNPLGAK